MTHKVTRMVQVPNSGRYGYKNWSFQFECPACHRAVRQNTNFLGRRVMGCDGERTWKLPPDHELIRNP